MILIKLSSTINANLKVNLTDIDLNSFESNLTLTTSFVNFCVIISNGDSKKTLVKNAIRKFKRYIKSF